MEQQIARIALSGVPYSADKLYSYLVPPELADACRAGVRVSVPFGRGNRRTEGFVLETLCEATDKPLKPVFTVLDEQPLLDTSLLRLAKWMKARYFCTVYDALKTILPAGIWFRYRETYRLADDVQESDLSALAAANRTDKLLLEAITARGELERSELEELGGASLADALLAPTRIYVKPVLELLRGGAPVHAIAHITGGGITENLNRALADDVDAVVTRNGAEMGWDVPPVITYVSRQAELAPNEACKTFNMGVGLCLIVAPEDEAAVTEALVALGEKPFRVGECVEGSGKVVYSDER